MKIADYLKNKKVVFGGLGAAIVALCCFTPILVWVVIAAGLAGVVAYLDYVLLPLLAVALFVTYAGVKRVQKQHAKETCRTPAGD